ncbi:hypothetical protein D3C71_701700 [compost metagenome]
MRLAHDVGENVQAAAVGHADDDFFKTQLAAALDDLFECRDQRFAAIEAETLGALELDVEELFVAFAFDQLRKDRLLAFRGEGNALVRTFDPFLDPGLFFRARHMHEFDADRRAIGALEDRDHLANGRVFHAQNVVDEDLAIVIALFEAVGLRRQFVVVLDRACDAERIELGVQVAAHAIGADHHDGAHAVAARLMNVGFVDGCALGGSSSFSLCLHLGFDCLFHYRPVAVESGNKVATGCDRPVRTLPGSALRCLLHVFGAVGEGLEEGLPFFRNRIRIGFVIGIKLFDIDGVRAI